MTTFAFAIFASAVTAVCPAVPALATGGAPLAVAVIGEELEALYRGGLTFDEFYRDADARRALWVQNYEGGEIAAEMVARVEALGGAWRILAVAEAACSDSVNTIPFLALLAERAANLELRIVSSDEGREVMETHRTPDDRAATPTILVLNDRYDDVGCWVERPADLQTWAMDARPRLGGREFLAQKMAWYAEDAGASTVREIVDVLEAASAGTPVCGSG
ncbi:MAG: thioredoxin family protein [Gemmatimonadota bacterium]|nr:thioredoxin family protein [Gemmatimonadota bacterium]